MKKERRMATQRAALRPDDIFQLDLSANRLQTDRIFFWLLISQWIAGTLVALVWSPRTWIAEHWSLHQHVLAAVLLGGLFAAYPLYLIVASPGARWTRHMIAIGQMLQSALLVHVTGGRIETHFHVFVSLALLAYYRDWTVLVTAAVIVYADHLALGIWFPLSVYGVPSATIWRSVEHACWVVLAIIFLRRAIRQSVRELWAIAEREVRLEETAADLQRSNANNRKMTEMLQAANRDLEATVTQRTHELNAAKQGLEEQVRARTAELVAAKEGLEREVSRRTNDLSQAKQKLEEQVRELGLLNRAMMGREERILELKETLKALRAKMAALTGEPHDAEAA